jgi:hypothetical protein
MRNAVFLGGDAMSDIVERLRKEELYWFCYPDYLGSDLPEEAADEITRLRAENRELSLQLLQAQGQAADAIAERDELQAVFDKTREANMRAIKRWQEVTGRDKSWPDHDYLILWLLERWDEARAALRLFYGYGCPACGGDCGSANPPVNLCPVQAAHRALAERAP